MFLGFAMDDSSNFRQKNTSIKFNENCAEILKKQFIWAVFRFLENNDLSRLQQSYRFIFIVIKFDLTKMLLYLVIYFRTNYKYENFSAKSFLYYQYCNKNRKIIRKGIFSTISPATYLCEQLISKCMLNVKFRSNF